jgi:hypothetical protein
MDHDRSIHSKVLTSLENTEFPEKVILVVVDSHEKRSLDFG